MPDAGDYETRSAPASPANWGDAFAALPAEVPPADGWRRLQSRLPETATRRTRRHWPLWLATAAALALVMVMVVPLRMSQQATIDPLAPAADQPATEDVIVRHPGAGRDDENTALMVSARPATTPAANRSKPDRPPRIAPAHRPMRTAAEPAGTTRLAIADAATQPIESLHAESAQLEQLLAMVRDDRVASATSVALSSDLDNHIAGIDDALAQPDLDTTDRDRLWQQRVDALQQLVGIETTNRLLSARGEHFNASLVSID